MSRKSDDLEQNARDAAINRKAMTGKSTAHVAGTKEGRPVRVVLGLTALWTAWVMSAVALSINQFFFHGLGIGPGLSLGILSLTFQAVVFVFVARGHASARIFAVAFLMLAALPLQMLSRLIVDGSLWSATYTTLGFLLKATAVFLLFTGDAKEWFASQS